MSASLVGSEMCIRDSCWSQQGSKGTKNCSSSPKPPSSSLTSKTGRRRACLLYTSDAADDM
eukprot:3598057-Alexandrium_andersonii.AAC.1